eukprot:EG_transcript_38201
MRRKPPLLEKMAQKAIQTPAKRPGRCTLRTVQAASIWLEMTNRTERPDSGQQSQAECKSALDDSPFSFIALPLEGMPLTNLSVLGSVRPSAFINYAQWSSPVRGIGST